MIGISKETFARLNYLADHELDSEVRNEMRALIDFAEHFKEWEDQEGITEEEAHDLLDDITDVIDSFLENREADK